MTRWGRRAAAAVAGAAVAWPAAAAAPAPLLAQPLGVVPRESYQLPSLLARLDATTLEPLAHQQATLVQDATPVLSRDGREVAFGSQDVAAVSIAGTTPPRPAGSSILLSRTATSTTGLAWPSPRRLLALAGPVRHTTCRTARLFVVDPESRRVIRSRRLAGVLVAAQPTPRGMAVLLGGCGTITADRLVLIAADGSSRTVVLSGIDAGFERVGGNGERDVSPALAVGGNAAYVVGASTQQVATVALDTGALSVHQLPLPRGVASPARGVVVLANGQLGIASVTGLYLVDTHTWQVAASVPFQGHIGAIIGDLLIDADQNSVAIHNLDGSLRTTLPVAGVGNFQLYRDHLFFRLVGSSDHYAVVDLTTGALTTVDRELPQLVPGQPGVAASASTP